MIQHTVLKSLNLIGEDRFYKTVCLILRYRIAQPLKLKYLNMGNGEVKTGLNYRESLLLSFIERRLLKE